MKIRLIAAITAVIAATAVFATSSAFGARAPKTTKYMVVFKAGHFGSATRAVRAAGGRIVRVNKIGVATVASSNPRFERTVRASRFIAGVARNATFFQPALAAAPPPAGTRTATAEAAACAALYSVPIGIGPEPLSACQWDMRAIGASPSKSYAVNRGAGVKVGDLDTGIDLGHPDIAPNLDVANSCSFIYASTPTSDPAEQVTPGDCSNKSAVQDLNGHGTHTAGTMAAPINGVGVAGVAPRATIVALKAGTIEGFFFTQSVVDGLVYAGDKHLDVVNMSFFADPWLFNCRNDAEQKAIVQAIGRAARYAQQRGVIDVAAPGGSRFQTPTFDSARGRVLSPYSADASDLALEASLGRLVQDSTGAYWAWLNGTSMAAPHAAGVVALIRASHPAMPAGSVVASLRQTATKMPCPTEHDPGVEFFGAPLQVCSGGIGSNSFFGAGLVNALAAALR